MYCMYWPTGARKPPPRPQNTVSWSRTQRSSLRACGPPLYPLIQSHLPTRSCASPSRSMCPRPHLLSSATAGEQPVPAARESILPQALSHRHCRSGMVASPHSAGLGSRRPSKKPQGPPYRDWLVCGRRSPPYPQKNLPRAQHPAGPTQGISGHVPIHFIPPASSNSRTRFLRATCVQGLILGPSLSLFGWPQLPIKDPSRP